ncbi:unnamed protein product [Alopecurus aequalis]
METSQPSAAAADYPPWVIFAEQKRFHHKAGLCPSPADTRTVAHARTSTGHFVRASFRFAAPPAVSRLDLDLDQGLPDGVAISPTVVVAHGDSVLICISLNMKYIDEINTTDFFVYTASAGARSPSLSLLPPCYMDWGSSGRRYQKKMSRKGTGILRRDDGELVVTTDLKIEIIPCDDDGGAKRVEGELRVLRSSDSQWKAERLPVRHDVNRGEVISYCWWKVWDTDWAIPVGDRFLYWVDLHHGIVFSDMSEESPELTFVPLPVGVEPILRQRTDWDRPASSRSVCATDGGETVKFVHVSPRCCCRGPGTTKCELSRHAFTITTWTLRKMTQGGDMGWEMDAVVDCGDLWALDAYRHLPRLPMGFPVVSIDDPDVVCFLLSEHKHLDGDGDKTTWVVMVDTRTKALLRSAILYSKDEYYCGEDFLPSQLSRNFSYFNTSHGAGSSKHSVTPARRCRENIVDASPAANRPPSPDKEILAALQEIPGLTRDEMLRAYGVLACDDRRRYCSLVALPMNMRKDYCSMLVDMGRNKCSSCSARLAAATRTL